MKAMKAEKPETTLFKTTKYEDEDGEEKWPNESSV